MRQSELDGAEILHFYLSNQLSFCRPIISRQSANICVIDWFDRFESGADDAQTSLMFVIHWQCWFNVMLTSFRHHLDVIPASVQCQPARRRWWCWWWWWWGGGGWGWEEVSNLVAIQSPAHLIIAATRMTCATPSQISTLNTTSTGSQIIDTNTKVSRFHYEPTSEALESCEPPRADV